MEAIQKLSSILSAEDITSLHEAIKSKMVVENLHPSQEWNGFKFLPGFSVEAAKTAYNSKPRMGDVFLMSFPKTGTNWTAEVIQRILFEDEEEYELVNSLPLFLKVLDMEPGNKLDMLQKFPLKRRVFGAHLPPELLNVESIRNVGAKIVYVMRNPKDQMVSWYKFAATIPHGKVEPIKSMISSGWDAFFNHVVKGDFPMMTKPGEWYPDNILSWYKHRDNKTVYFIHYEDMKKDLVGQIKVLADFLEAPVTKERAKQIADACSFDTMKRNKAKGDSVQAELLSKIMRKGGVGGWKDYFTVSQSEQIDAIIKEKLKDTDIKFTYEL